MTDHAKQPGKAADPRPVCTARFMRNGKREVCGQPNCSDPDHRTQIAEDVRRPAHPQALAEPWRSPGSSGERLTLHELLSRAAEGYRQLGGDLRAAAEHFREHPPEAATLREERDRLAEELETAEARLSTARGQAEAFAKTAREARAKVAERDARIAALTARAEGALALAETYRKAWRAALGAPEENT